MSYDSYEKTRGAVVVSAGMLVKYWLRGDRYLSAMIAELGSDVDAHLDAVAEMNEEANNLIAKFREAA